MNLKIYKKWSKIQDYQFNPPALGDYYIFLRDKIKLEEINYNSSLFSEVDYNSLINE